jgi:hypothetical protein
MIDQIHELILEDRRISAKSIAEQLGISHERLGPIIHENFDMLLACFLPGRDKDLSAPLYCTYTHTIHTYEYYQGQSYRVKSVTSK